MSGGPAEQVKLRGLFELFECIGRRGQIGGGDDRAVVGQQQRVMVCGRLLGQRSERRVTGGVVGQQRQRARPAWRSTRSAAESRCHGRCLACRTPRPSRCCECAPRPGPRDAPGTSPRAGTPPWSAAGPPMCCPAGSMTRQRVGVECAEADPGRRQQQRSVVVDRRQVAGAPEREAAGEQRRPQCHKMIGDTVSR